MNRELTVLAAMEAEMASIPGHVGFYYKNLVTGFTYGVRADEVYFAASVIKFPLLLHVLRRAAEGEISLSDKLTVKNHEKVPSCGALNQFTGPVEADILTLCRLMTVISDNTATNKLLTFCGFEEVNASFRQMGLEKTVARRVMFDYEAAARGLQNTICPLEIGTLLEQLYKKEFHSEEVSRLALDILLDQQIGHKLEGKLTGIPVAHKTGEDDGLSNDVGIVFAKEPFVICFAGHDTDVYRWEDLIRRSADALVQVQMD